MLGQVVGKIKRPVGVHSVMPNRKRQAGLSALTFKKRFLAWWSRPATSKERMNASLLSAWAGLWFGAIFCLLLQETPVSLVVIAKWSAAGSVLSAAMGAIFPRVMRCVSFPFAFLGVGGGP